MTERQSGRTTTQMLDAPHGSIFIWCNNMLSYPLNLARHLGRKDLHILPPEALDMHGMTRGNITGVVIDHAAELSPDQLAEAAQILERLKRKQALPK